MTRLFLAGTLACLMFAGCSRNDQQPYNTQKPVIDQPATSFGSSTTIKGGDTLPGSSGNTGSGTGMNSGSPAAGSSRSMTNPDSTPIPNTSRIPMDNDPATPDRQRSAAPTDPGAIQNVDKESNNPNPATPSGGALNNN